MSLYDADIKKVLPTQQIPNGKNWSGRTIKQMAEEIHFGEDYEVIYSDLSRMTHSSSAISHQYLTYDDTDDTFIPVYYPNEVNTDIIALTTASYALRILKVFNENMSCNKEQIIEALIEKIDDSFFAMRKQA